MSTEDLSKLDDLLKKFVVERDAELAESIGKVTSLSLASKIYEHEHDNLEHANFTQRWVMAILHRSMQSERL